MHITVLYILLLDNLSSNYAAKYCNGDSCEEEQGIKLLEDFNAAQETLCKKETLSVWNLYVDISEENQITQNNVLSEVNHITNEFIDEASQCDWRSFSDPVIRRQFQFLTQGSSKQLPPNDSKQKSKAENEMKSIFGTATVCPYGNNETIGENCSMAIDNGIQQILSKSHNFDELLYYWKTWRDATGRKMRNLYAQYVPLANKEATINGYPDLGARWRSEYDVENLSGKSEEIWVKILPLYKQLHAYVRRKLIEAYGEDKMCTDGPIPAHLLGEMTGESWINLENLIRPYPKISPIDITPVMKERNMTMLDVAKIAEDFFVSLGLSPMTAEFWNNSIFERIPGRAMNCHPGSLDMCNGDDFRMVTCGTLSMFDLRVVHHEMGHVQYFMQYAHQPPLFHTGANPGFHEAIGDTIALSALTPNHWKTIGFVENVTDDEEQDLNTLFSIALDKLAPLPHIYIVDKWRWDLFDGIIPIDDMNSKWWEYRLKYEGTCPSVRRTEEDLDPAALFHVPAQVSYSRYFLSLVFQFQFHKALCDAAGYVGPLHKCDIYGSKDAGERLKAMLSLGASKPWSEAMETLTNGVVDDLDVTPMLEYFQPLQEWLEKQNVNETIGWSSDDATICP